jgi:hypothetical protein
LAAVDLDGDGWPDFLLTRNNATALAFHNQGVAGRHSLRVALRGPAGNPTAIGAQVSLEMTDGSRQTAEVFAGSGYYSQSTPACFFGWTDANPPRRLHLRWPNGSTSTAEVPANSVTLTISAGAP